MAGFELLIFPDGSVLTVATTVLIGVWVIGFFNLSFGSTLSGLVVPGYIVPLMIAKPWAAGVIVIEGILTYLIVVALSERPRFLPYWCSFFGRDRFFAIVLVSVLVRAIGDGWLLPLAGQWADQNLGIAIDYRNDLHSYGLIIVALLANSLWKPGLVRGLTTTMFATFVTYLLTRYVLVRFTNFNIGELEYLYEDISSSLLASPKAYIILITTAYLASWMNLRYSWEFNGILIPALLGLLWHEPLKIVVSLVESGVLFGLGSMLLQLSVFRRVTMTGARKLLFFFTLCFALRLTLAHLIPIVAPEARVSEVYGFGFLLSTLMAIKAHDKKLGVRLVVATLQVSLAGTLLGSLIGFGLLKLPTALSLTREVSQQSTVPIVSSESLNHTVKTDKLLLYKMRAYGRYKPPLNSELVKFRRTIELAKGYVIDPAPAKLDAISQTAASCNYQVSIIQDRYLYLSEQSSPRGWGIYVFDLEKPNGQCIEVPAPLDEWSTIESGLMLAEEFGASAIAIAGADRQTNKDGSSDVLSQPRTMFGEFHRLCSSNGVLQVRGHTRSGLRTINRVLERERNADLANVGSQLWVKTAMPVGLRPKTLRELVPGFELLWQDSPMPNVLRAQSTGTFAELRLSRKDRRRLLTRLMARRSADGVEANVETQIGDLQKWLLGRKHLIAPQASNAYQVPSIAEMLFFDQEILTPLFKTLSRNDAPQVIDGRMHFDIDTHQDLRAMQAAARSMDYELIVFHDEHTSEAFAVLYEPNPTRYWGSYVFRWYLAEPFVIEVPRPLLERNVYEFGVSTFHRPAASSLLLATAHPRANTDGSADAIRLVNSVNLLNLTRQVLLRETGQRPLLVLQARAIQSPTKADVVMATDRGNVLGAATSPLKKQVLQELRNRGMESAFVDGSFDTAGYEVSNGLRASTSDAWQNKEVATLWLSPDVRVSFRDQTDNLALATQCAACDIVVSNGDVYEAIASRTCSLPTTGRRDLAEAMKAYLDDPDIVRLAELRSQFANWHWEFVQDRRSGQAFFLISETLLHFPLAIRATGYSEAILEQSIPLNEFTRQSMDQFIGSRRLFLQFEGEQP